MTKQIVRKSNKSDYERIVEESGLAEHSPVKGCMTIKPFGCALWEEIRSQLDKKIGKMYVSNVYFPMLIPERFIQKEKDHVKGFDPECVVATEAGGKPLKERLFLRPTSETIIYEAFSRWLKSYRDMDPQKAAGYVRVNQWANIIRWEKRPRLFLRTTEFLWQEGHTAHSTEQKADNMTRGILEMYYEFMRDYLAIDTIRGKKTDSEKFAGANYTLSIEGLMSDKKALQMGTSHNLGQNFARVFNIKFANEKNKEEFAWQTSWGVSTRIIGALILSHSDKSGLIIPPRIAPWNVVIIPIWDNDDKDKDKDIKDFMDEIGGELEGKYFSEEDIEIRSRIDGHDWEKPGWKFNFWEKKGVPLRIEVGPRDLKNNQVVLVPRDDRNQKKVVDKEKLVDEVKTMLLEIQGRLLKKSEDFLKDKANTHTANSYDELKKIIKEEGGFVRAGWCSKSECEEKVKEETQATIRCIPFPKNSKYKYKRCKFNPDFKWENEIEKVERKKKCVVCDKPAKHEVIFAKAY
ncbi:proline--tRNA ligase [Patescibacteria group bacterium]